MFTKISVSPPSKVKEASRPLKIELFSRNISILLSNSLTEYLDIGFGKSLGVNELSVS